MPPIDLETVAFALVAALVIVLALAAGAFLLGTGYFVYTVLRLSLAKWKRP